MIQQDSLARLTLDTLPFSIGVLDDDGTILFTNRAWLEFTGLSEDGASRGEVAGVNYFEVMDPATDDDAARALAGLEAVAEGREEVFTMEFPADDDGETRWFLMRATSLPEHDTGSVVVAHIEITGRKSAEIRAQEQRAELERVMARIDGLVEHGMEAVLRANTREEIEATVCERLATLDAYAGAWVGEVDLRTDSVVPAQAGGTVDLPADGAVPLDGSDPVATAVTAQRPQVIESATTGTVEGALAPIHESTLEEAGAMAAFPLVYNDTRYGVLVVYADQPAAFDEPELAVLQILTRFASTAINAIEGRRILTTDRVVEVELELAADELFFGQVAAEVGCTLEYEGTLYEDDGSVVMLFVADGAEPARVVEAAAGTAGVEQAARMNDGESGRVLEFVVEEPPVVSPLAERGAETTAITADGTGVTVTLELPASAKPRTVIEQLAERYPSTELVARHERDRPDRTREELVADIEEALTDRQELALQKAHVGGFFDWPRDISGEELAESMDISPSTYHQHLRTAERKIFTALLED